MKNFQDEVRQIRKFCESEQYLQELKLARDLLSAKPIILYGAGAEGLEFLNVLQFCGINPICFCDKNKTGIESHSGVAIISPKALLEKKYCEANILISSSMYKTEIEDDLKQLGIPQDRILSRSLWFRLCLSVSGDVKLNKFLAGFQYLLMFHAISEMIKGKSEKLLSGYERTYQMLADDKSKQVLIDRIKFCLTGALITRDPLDMVYFDPELVVLSETEVFADCGMYTADTAADFFKLTNNKYTHYYGFEPDAENFNIARKFLSDRPNVTTSAKGLWSIETNLSFKDGCLSCSMVCEEGESYIQVTSLDEYFADKPHVPTFIKMDIEGSELEALKGAESIIKKHKPRLAICIYHKPEDMYTLPDIIKRFRSDYVLYLRHYTDTICDTVLYAI